jgi:CheY-like chemotaxis protein
MDTILFIEDERLPMIYYIKELERSGFNVKEFHSPEDAVAFAQTKPQLALIILDIMMPPGEKYKEEDTKDGLRTGVFLFRDLSILYQDLPIIILTNVGNSETLGYFRDRLNCKVVQKLECPPFALVQLVKEMIATAKKTSDKLGER